jgi:hypothetical protein
MLPRIACFAVLSSSGLATELTAQQRVQIDRITGTKGVYTVTEDVYKASYPRNDLKVMVDGTSGGEVMVMGDMTLAEDEVNP